MSAPITTRAEHGGAVERIVLCRPKANILDEAMVDAIRAHLRTLTRPELKLVVFEGEGKHFSFGASVEEHLPERVGSMLPGFHALFHELEALGVPTAAVVRGQCLGGGFELATWCGVVFASPTSSFAVPEVKLAVFPPVAAMALRWRCSGATASRLVFTGEAVDGRRGAEIGLVDTCDEDPEAALQAWLEAHVLPLSAKAMRYAWRASRTPVALALEHELPRLERLYLNELMKTHDAVEGITAFVERRPPQWSHQ